MKALELMEQSFYPVEKVRDENSKYGWAVINAETGKKISEVSEDYVLVPNRDAVMPFIERYGEDSLVSVARGAASYSYKFDLGREIDMGGGDALRRQGYVNNSYDKTMRFRWQDAWLRKVCSNGMFSFQSGASVSEIHYGKIDYNRMIDDALAASQEPNVSTWIRLKNIPVKHSEKIGIINRFEVFPDAPTTTANGSIHPSHSVNSRIKYYAGMNAGRCGHDLDNQENGWGLLNNLNWGIARVTKGERNIQRTVEFNRRAEKYLVETILN